MSREEKQFSRNWMITSVKNSGQKKLSVFFAWQILHRSRDITHIWQRTGIFSWASVIHAYKTYFPPYPPPPLVPNTWTHDVLFRPVPKMPRRFPLTPRYYFPVSAVAQFLVTRIDFPASSASRSSVGPIHRPFTSARAGRVLAVLPGIFLHDFALSRARKKDIAFVFTLVVNRVVITRQVIYQGCASTQSERINWLQLSGRPCIWRNRFLRARVVNYKRNTSCTRHSWNCCNYSETSPSPTTKTARRQISTCANGRTDGRWWRRERRLLCANHVQVRESDWRVLLDSTKIKSTHWLYSWVLQRLQSTRLELKKCRS